MKVTSLLIFLLSVTALASDLSIKYAKNGVLILASDSCSSLVEHHQAICDWKKQIGPKFKSPQLTERVCKKHRDGKFRTKVTSCLPSFVKKYQEKKLYKSGANCWGTAMSLKGHSIRPRFIWSKEFMYWMESPLCRKLDMDEEPKVGDVMLIFGPEYIFERTLAEDTGTDFWKALYEGRYTLSVTPYGYSGYHTVFHAETYLGPGLTFGKTSPSHDDPFMFTEMNKVYARPRKENCAMAQDFEPHLREYQKEGKIDLGPCKYLSQMYRCTNFNQYFSEQDLNANHKLIIEEINALQIEQDKLFELLINSRFRLSKEEKARIVNLSDSTTKITLEELLKRDHDKTMEMLLSWKYFTSAGLKKSLEFADLI